MTALVQTLPVLLVGGFLGAGKTTLINHVLTHADGRRLAVLVNDFGDVSIDAQLIESSESNVLHIAGGCMCCSYGDDLVGALRQLALRRDSFDRVLIETSGVSLLYPIACTIPLIPGFALHSTMVLVDAVSFLDHLEDPLLSDTVLRQLACANLIVINKTDLVSEARRGLVAAEIQRLYPSVETRVAVRAALSPDMLWGAAAAGLESLLHAVGERRHDTNGLFSAGQRPQLQPVPHQPSDTFCSRTLEMPGHYDFARLGKALEACGPSLLRAKVLARNTQGRWMVLSVSAGRHETSEHARRPSSGYGVFIVRAGSDADSMFAKLAACGVPMPNKSEVHLTIKR